MMKAAMQLLVLVLLTFGNSINAHLTIACTNMPQSTKVVYTRADSGTTEDMYHFTASYHWYNGCGTGRWYESLLWVQEHPINSVNPQCKSVGRYYTAIPQLYDKVGDGIVTYVNADRNQQGKYHGHQAYGQGLSNPANLNKKDTSRNMPNQFTLAYNNYMGSQDINDWREHCTSAAAWTSYWYNYPPYKLTALFDGSNRNKALAYGKQKKALVCFQGFGCESRGYKYEFTVQRGCPAGDDNRGGTNNGYKDYCITCPAGRYTDPDDIASKPALSINDCKQCPEGTYGDEENSPNRDGKAYCVKCPAGRYGGTKALSDATCSGLCVPGYYCPEDSQIIEVDTVGRFTLPSDVSIVVNDVVTIIKCAQEVNNGVFKVSAVDTNQGSVVPANKGKIRITLLKNGASINTNSDSTGCMLHILNEKNTGGEIGNGPKMVRGGRFGNFGSLTVLGSSKCPAGYYCPAGSGSEECDLGKTVSVNGHKCRYRCIRGPNCLVVNDTSSSRCYCPSSSAAPKYVSPGFYASGEGNDHYPVETRDSQQQCPATQFCLGGACSGVHCDGNHHNCPAGRYGQSVGISSKTCTGECSAGFYCPGGSRWPTEKQCGNITNYCPKGSGEPKVADDNHYTFCPPKSPQGPNCGVQTRENQKICDPGYFCSGGGIVNVFWEHQKEIHMCRYVSSNNRRVGEGAAKVSEAVSGAPVRVDSGRNGIYVKFGTGATAEDKGNVAAKFSQFRIDSVKCTDGLKEGPYPALSNSTFVLKNLTSAKDNGAGLYAKDGGLTSTICVDYLVKIVIEHHQYPKNATAECTVRVKLLATNKPPVYNRNFAESLKPRAVPEREDRGTVVNTYDLGIPDLKKGVNKLGLLTEPIATDPDKGQDLVYSIAASYPVGANETDFGISQCTGDLFTLRTLDYDTGPKDGKYHLCIKVCDDPTFFPGETKGLCADNSGINNLTTCGNHDNGKLLNACNDLGGVCVNVTVLNVNDPPFFNTTADSKMIIDELKPANTEVTNGDLNKLVIDLDPNDKLDFRIECFSCPEVIIDTVLRTTSGKVTSRTPHGLKSGDVVQITNVKDMPELSARYSYFTITNGGIKTFFLNVDTSNFASGTVGSGGKATHMYIRMWSDGILRSTILLRSNVVKTVAIQVYANDQSLQPPAVKFFTIKVQDVNDRPTLPWQTIFISEDWNPIEGLNSSHKNKFVASSNLQGFQALDPDGIYYPNNDPLGVPDINYFRGGANGYFLDNVTKKKWVVIPLNSPSEHRAVLRPKFELNYEETKEYNVSVWVRDIKGDNNTGIIRVKVVDVNEPPTIQDITLEALSEGTPTRKTQYCDENNTCVTNTSLALLVSFAQYKYRDPEDGNLTLYDSSKMQGVTFGFDDGNGNSIQYYPPKNGINTGQYFYIDSLTGSVYLNNNIDYEDVNKNFFSATILVTQVDPITGVAAPPSKSTFTVNVTNINEAPVIPKIQNNSVANSFKVDEIVTNSDTARNVTNDKGNSQLTAVDPEGHDIKWKIIDGNTYRPESQNANEVVVFKVTESGMIYVVPNATKDVLDYEGKQAYVITVQATDATDSSLYSQGTVGIQLIDKNDPPSLVSSNTGSSTARSTMAMLGWLPNSEAGMIDGPVMTGKDPDGCKVIYSISNIFIPADNTTEVSWSHDEILKIDPSSGQISVKAGVQLDTKLNSLGQRINGMLFEKNVTNFTMRVDVALTEDKTDNSVPSVNCSAGLSSGDVPIYLNIPKYSLPFDITSSMYHDIFTETTALGTTIGHLYIQNNKSLSYTIKSVSPSPLYANDGTQFTGSPTTLTDVNDIVSINSDGQFILESNGIDFENNAKQQAWNGQIGISVQIYDSDTQQLQTETFYINLTNVNEEPFWSQTGLANPVDITIGENSAPPTFQEDPNLVALDMDCNYTGPVFCDYNNTGSINKKDLTLPADENLFKCTSCVYSIVSVIGTTPNGTVVSIETADWPFKQTNDANPPTFYGSKDIMIGFKTPGTILNYEDYTSYDIIIGVGNGVTRKVKIVVKDENEAPILVKYQYGYIDENGVDALAVYGNGNFNAIDLGSTYIVVDPDTYTNFQFKILGVEATSFVNSGENVSLPNYATLFDITSTGGSINMKSKVEFDFENCSQYEVQWSVDDGGIGPGTPSLNDTGSFTIKIRNLNDLNAPNFGGSGVAATYALETNGGDEVFLYGTNLGSTAFKYSLTGRNCTSSFNCIVVKYGPRATNPFAYTATNCYMVERNTKISCKTVPGVGGDLAFSVTVDGHTSPLSAEGISFKPPEITNVELITKDGSMHTKGGEGIVITGQNFGPNGTLVDLVSYENNMGETILATKCTVIVPYKKVRCYTAPGTGKDLKFKIRFGGQDSTGFDSNLTYTKPTISGFTVPTEGGENENTNDGDGSTNSGGISINGAGGQAIEINGDNFGDLGTTVRINIGPAPEDPFRYVATACTVVVGHTKLQCVLPPGVGTNHSVTITVADQTTTYAGLYLSYKPPIITGVNGPGAKEAETVGGATIYIEGEHFGPATGVHGAELPCDYPTTFSTTSNGNQTTRQHAALRAKYGKVNVMSYVAHCCAVVSDRSIQCQTGQGTGKDHVWKISVGNQMSNVFAANTSYGSPVIREYQEVTTPVDNLNTIGSEEIDIFGANFGYLMSDIHSITYGENGIEYQVNLTSCRFLTNHTLIRCITLEGSGRGHRWLVNVNGQVSVNPTTAYALPVVKGISLSSDPTSGANGAELSTFGGDIVNITGSNFGPAGASTDLIRVSYGPNGRYYIAKDCKVVIASTLIQCKTAAGIGKDHMWTVEINGQASLQCGDKACTSRYKAINIVSIAPSEGTTEGPTFVTLKGYNFGSVSFNPSEPNVPTVLFEGAPHGVTTRVLKNYQDGDLEEVAVNIGSGFGKGKTIELRLQSGSGETVSSNIIMFNYSDPTVFTLQLTSSNDAPQGKKKLTVKGKNFCAFRTCAILYICNCLEDEFPGCCSETPEARMAINPTFSHSHTKIEAFTSLEKGSVIVSIGEPGTDYALRQNSVVKMWKDVSPIIITSTVVSGMNPPLNDLTYARNGEPYDDPTNDDTAVDIPYDADTGLYKPYRIDPDANENTDDSYLKEDLDDVQFTPNEGDEIMELLVQDVGDIATEVCVTIGTCVDPETQTKPPCNNATIPTNGKLCDPNDLGGGRIVKLILPGGFEEVKSAANPALNLRKLRFRIPAGVGKGNELRIWRSDQPSYNDEKPVKINFKPPQLKANTPLSDNGDSITDVNVDGAGMKITIEGKHFGVVSDENLVLTSNSISKVATLTFGGVDLINNPFGVTWSCTQKNGRCTEDYKIEVNLPQGQGGFHDLVLTVGGQTTKRQVQLQYKFPSDLKVDPNTVNTAGGEKVKISGKNLGCVSTSPIQLCSGGHKIIFVDPKYNLVVPCSLGNNAVSVSEINCTIGEGQGQNLRLNISMNKLRDPKNGTSETSKENVISFKTPTINHTDPTQGIFIEGQGKANSDSEIEGSTDGKNENGESQKLSIAGSNFGLPNSSDVTVEFECVSTSKFCQLGKKIILNRNSPVWKNNHSFIETVMPEGVGKNLAIKICVAGQCELLTQTFSFGAPNVLTLTPNAGLTDGCKDGSWEPLSVWYGRTDGATAAQIKRNPQLQRICNSWTKIKITGKNFGPFKTSLKVTVGKCTDYKTKEICEGLVGKGKCQWLNDKCEKLNPDLDDSTFTIFDGAMVPSSSNNARRLLGGTATNNVERQHFTTTLLDVHNYMNRNNGRRLKQVNCDDPDNLQTRDEKCICGKDIKITHTELSLCAPVGFGVNLTLRVSVQNRPSAGDIKWSFGKPKVTSALPRPYDAMGGEKLVLRGINFGPVETDTKIKLGTLSCTESTWKNNHESDGRPYVECIPVEDVVGSKNVSLSVALQDADQIVGLENTANSIVSSRCKPGEPDEKTGTSPNYYAAPDELCSPCPQGAICKGGSYDDPISQTRFWRDPLDITEATGEEIDDIMGDKAAADYEKAAGLRAVTGDEGTRTVPRRCAEKRLFTPDIRSKFPHAFQRDKCYDFIPCLPPASCLGGNKCEIGYQHQKMFCQKKVDDGKIPDEQKKCTVSLQCRSRSGGTTCTRAIEDVCECPPEWEWRERSFSCLKKCLRDPLKMSKLDSACEKLIGRAETVEGKLFQIIARGECMSRNPEDCAECVEVKNATGGPSTGVCQCVSAKRCAFCTATTHYKIDGKCEECPANPELVIIGFILGIICVCLAMRWLDKRRFNLAFINIGWDYFQVLAMFTDCDVDWPPALKHLYRALSFFSFDIDIVAPECLVPDFPYETKFWMVVLSPLILGAFLMLCWAVYMAFNSCWMNRGRDKLAHAKFTAVFLLSNYYLYISVTRRALEIFNCNPLDPDDGLLYTSFTSYECDSGPCECGNPRHVQVRLVAPAILAIVYMTCGFPIIILFLLRRNKTLVKEDQLLRAHDTGDSIFTNPRSFYLRTWLHKMYFYFKPGKTYWIIVIIARKMFICMAALMFRANPGFQLAFVLLVLFICYVLQVKHQPYMSTVQRNEALAEHHKKAYEERDPEHMRIEESIKAAFAYVQKKRSISDHRHKRNDVEFSDSGNLIHRTGIDGHKQKYFWDYNTVEQILLACAILVCLSGIMFESDRFENDKFGKFAWQRELITWIVLLVVVFSIVYYSIVLISEIWGKVPKFIEKIFANKTKVSQTKSFIHGDSMDDVTFSTNPVFLNDGKDLEKLKQDQAKQIEHSEMTAEALMERNAILQQRLRAAQQKDARKSLNTSLGEVEMAPRRKKNKKKAFDFSDAGGEVAVVDGKVVAGQAVAEEVV